MPWPPVCVHSSLLPWSSSSAKGNPPSGVIFLSGLLHPSPQMFCPHCSFHSKIFLQGGVIGPMRYPPPWPRLETFCTFMASFIHVYFVLLTSILQNFVVVSYIFVLFLWVSSYQCHTTLRWFTMLILYVRCNCVLTECVHGVRLIQYLLTISSGR